MKQDFQFWTWCKSERGAAGLFLVVITGLCVGYYSWLALVAPPLPTYRVDFTGAQWIAAPEGEPNVYFRKKIYVNGPVEHAWLEATASDQFAVFVNNSPVPANVALPPALSSSKLVGTWTETMFSTNPSTLCDISNMLGNGANTIAVRVLRTNYPGPAKVRVRVGIRQGSMEREIDSDGSWKATSAPNLLGNLLPWTDPMVEDDLWPNAVVLPKSDDENLIQPAFVPPALFQSPIHGSWIGDGRSGRSHATFSKRFDAPAGNEHTWFQVAASGDYSVILNGHLVGDFISLSPQVQFVSLDHWIKSRDNEITVEVRASGTLPLLVGEISFTAAGSPLTSMGTDESWVGMTGLGTAAPGREYPAQAMKTVEYSAGRWGIPPKIALPATVNGPEALRQTIMGTALMALVAMAIIMGWVVSSRILCRVANCNPSHGFSLDALVHLPILLATALLLLLRYDVRLLPDCPVDPRYLVALLGALAVLHLALWIFRPQTAKSETRSGSPAASWRWLPRTGFAAGLLAIVALSFGLRLATINSFPLDQDDLLLRDCAIGVLERGYPSLHFGVVPTRLTTYELVPYFIALSTAFFGWSDWAVRVPAMIFGTLTTLVLGLMGRDLYNRRVGLFAALIHACLPWDVFWSLHCFHPQQDQFFALLCIWCYYHAIARPGIIEKKFFYGSCALFCLSYLSWEGTGFLLPVFAVTLLIMHPWQFGWLKQSHFWAGLVLVASLVVIQLSSRAMVLPNYWTLGYSLADLGGPQLFFLRPEWQPFFYIKSILLADPHLLLSVCLVAGLLLVRNSRPTRFCVAVFFGLLFCYSNLLPVYQPRYMYFYQTILILGASGALFEFARKLVALGQGFESKLARWLGIGGAFAATVLVFLCVMNWGFAFYRLSGPYPVDTGLRRGLRWQDIASAPRYVKANMRPGDVVVSDLTQAFYVYAGILPDYSTDILLGSRIVYDRTRARPIYVNSYTNIPVIRDYRQMMDILQGGRVWYVLANQNNTAPADAQSFVSLTTQQSRVVFSSYSSAVYLWEGLTPPSSVIATDFGIPQQPPPPPPNQSPLVVGFQPANSPSSQLPFVAPLGPQSVLEPESFAQLPLELPSPDQSLLPAVGSLQPARQQETNAPSTK